MTLFEALESKIRYALATSGLRPDVATVLDRALDDLRLLKEEMCASLSPRNGVPCQLPAGHQGSHYSSERNTGDWSTGLAEALRDA